MFSIIKQLYDQISTYKADLTQLTQSKIISAYLCEYAILTQ